MPEPKRDGCEALARSGSRCGRPTISGEPFCFFHSPSNADARRESSRKGGKARALEARAAKRAPPGTVLTAAELAAGLSQMFTALVEGATPVDARTATACATVARTINELAESAQLAERVRELEERIAGPNGRNWGT